MTSFDILTSLLDLDDDVPIPADEDLLGGFDEDEELVDSEVVQDDILNKGFLPSDPNFQSIVDAGGINASIRNDTWARNRLQEYRKLIKHNSTVALEDLPEEDASKLLEGFFGRVCKKNGDHYPTQSLMNLFRSFNRILRRKQIQRLLLTGVNEPDFKLRSHPKFSKVSTTCVLAMRKSRDQGANKPRKKSAVISRETEVILLQHTATSPQTSTGLQRRAIYYMLTYYGLRGGKEIADTRESSIEFGTDDKGDFARYDEKMSKNYKVSLDRYQVEHFRPALKVYDADVIVTFKTFIRHLPKKTEEIEDRFLLYQSIDNPRTISWYSKNRVSERRVRTILKEMLDELEVDTTNVTNTSGRTTCVTRMAVEGVPDDVGMLITGHKSKGAYQRYNQAKEADVRAATKVISEGANYQEALDVERQLLGDQVSGRKRNKENDVSIRKVQAAGEKMENDPSSSGISSTIENAEPLRESLTLKNYQHGGCNEIIDNDDSFDNIDWNSFSQSWPAGARTMGIMITPTMKFQNVSNCVFQIFNGPGTNVCVPSLSPKPSLSRRTRQVHLAYVLCFVARTRLL